MQVVALILERLPAAEALRAAGVSRGWRAAARSLTGLRLCFSITLHPHSTLENNPLAADNSPASAAGWRQLLCCAASTSASQIGELDLTVHWVAAPQTHAGELSAGGSASAAAPSMPRLEFPALQHLHASFPQPQGTMYSPQRNLLSVLSTNVLAALMRGCPELQELMICVEPPPHAYMGFRPLVPDQMLKIRALQVSPLEWTLTHAVSTLEKVTIRDHDVSLLEVLACLS